LSTSETIIAFCCGSSIDIIFSSFSSLEPVDRDFSPLINKTALDRDVERLAMGELRSVGHDHLRISSICFSSDRAETDLVASLWP